MTNRLVGTAAALAVMAMPVQAQTAAGDATGLLGAWELERETPRGTTTSIFTFAQEGDSVVVKVGSGENVTTVGKVDFDGAAVSFPIDMRAMMTAMRGAGRQPPGGQARGGAAGAGPARGGQARGGATGGGPARGEGAELPRFAGTLEGDEIRGAMAGPRGEQQLVLRRASSGG